MSNKPQYFQGKCGDVGERCPSYLWANSNGLIWALLQSLEVKDFQQKAVLDAGKDAWIYTKRQIVPIWV